MIKGKKDNKINCACKECLKGWRTEYELVIHAIECSVFQNFTEVSDLLQDPSLRVHSVSDQEL